MTDRASEPLQDSQRAPTCVGDGESPSQVPQRGAGAEARLSGQGVAVEVPLPAHRLEAEDLAVGAHVSGELQGREGGRVVHLDFEAGQRVQQRRRGHGDFVRAVVDALLQGEEGPAEGPRCGCQIRRS